MKRTIIVKAVNTDKILKKISVTVKVEYQKLTQSEASDYAESLKDAVNDMLRKHAGFNQSDITIQ